LLEPKAGRYGEAAVKRRAEPKLGEKGEDTLEARARRLYLDLLKGVLTRTLFGETRVPVEPWKGTLNRALYRPIKAVLGAVGFELTRRYRFDPDARKEGRDWPPEAETMVGLERLNNLERCIVDVIREEVPGDLIETGVWRGGATIFMRAVLEAYGDEDRIVWGADSFEGLPKETRHPADQAYQLWRRPRLSISLDEVKENFARYGFLDQRVRFLEGWFDETLTKAPIEKLSLLRLDGDFYESTMVALEALYSKLSVGGFLIVDDYHALQGCRMAVDEFRQRHGIRDELHPVDWACVYWRRT
jgi:O-methyltransferase